jgi:hypothetical protein
VASPDRLLADEHTSMVQVMQSRYVAHYFVKKEIDVLADTIEEAAQKARRAMSLLDGDKTELLQVLAVGVPSALPIDR